MGRALASVAVVAVSAALLVAVLGVSGSITGSINRLATSIGGDADLEVSGITDDGFDETLLEGITGVENVTAAVPMVRIRTAVNSTQALVLGLGQNASELHSDLQTAIQNQLDASSPVTGATNGVIVGGGLGIPKGAQVDVGPTRVTAVAAVDGPAARRLNDAHFVIAPLALAQRISGRQRRLDSVLIFTTPHSDVEEGPVRGDHGDRWTGSRGHAELPGRAGRQFVRHSAGHDAACRFGLVGGGGLSELQRDEYRDRPTPPAISTMRALGGKRRTIVGDMLAEAALVGFLGERRTG